MAARAAAAAAGGGVAVVLASTLESTSPQRLTQVTAFVDLVFLALLAPTHLLSSLIAGFAAAWVPE